MTSVYTAAHFFKKYNQLAASASQLDVLRKHNSVEAFFAALKNLWDIGDLGDDQLMQHLQACNRQPDCASVEGLAGKWIASSYRRQQIEWCVPYGAATQPFQDQYLSHCQQQLLNQFVRPRTSLPALLSARCVGAAPQPAGFIFHLSRCGSTLVSGCLAEFDTANVLSEPPAITELLLDTQLDVATQLSAIKQLLHLQMLAMPHQPHLIVKWNAWDLLRWSSIRAAWPEVPIIILLRDPLEILASHERQAGRHMAGDPSLGHLHPAFSTSTALDKNGDARFNLLARRVAILAELLQQVQASADQGVMLIDYRDITAQKIQQIAHFFGFPVTVQDELRITERMGKHSKELEKKFQPDSSLKRDSMDAYSRRYIENQLTGFYQLLLERAV